MNQPASQPTTQVSSTGQETPVVSGFDRSGASEDVLGELVALACSTLAAEGVENGQLDLILVERSEMAELNATHMGHEGPTDVLSFPLDQPGHSNSDVPIHLGDVVLCPAVAVAQAADHCGTIEAELSLLVIHGVLHVLGHDHAEPEESRVMRERETVHLARAGFVHPEPA